MLSAGAFIAVIVSLAWWMSTFRLPAAVQVRVAVRVFCDVGKVCRGGPSCTDPVLLFVSCLLLEQVRDVRVCVLTSARTGPAVAATQIAHPVVVRDLVRVRGRPVTPADSDTVADRRGAGVARAGACSEQGYGVVVVHGFQCARPQVFATRPAALSAGSKCSFGPVCPLRQWSTSPHDHRLCLAKEASMNENQAGEEVATFLPAPTGVKLRYCHLTHPGHPGEYIMRVDEARHDLYISSAVSNRLEAVLTEFLVDNRGTRIEIYSRTGVGFRDDATVVAAVTSVIADCRSDGLPLVL